MKKIHSLIHSLSTSEKRRFKLRLSNNKKDSYIAHLFDIINNLEKYNFDDIRIKGKRSAKQTRANLTLLYNFLLKVLRECEISENVRKQCRGELMDIITLEERGLINDAITKAHKLVKRSKELENYEAILDTLNELWRLNILNNSSSNKLEEIRNSIDETKATLIELYDYQKILQELTSVYIDFYYFKRNINVSLKADSALLDIKKLNKTCSRAAFKHYEIKSLSYTIKEEHKLSFEARKQQLEIVFSSSVYENDYLSKIQVLGKILKYFKFHFLLNQFNKYFSFYEKYFQPILPTIKDVYTIDNYYKTYFKNKCFQLFLRKDDKGLNELITLISELIKYNKVTNSNCRLSIYISLIEILLISKKYKIASNYFVLSFQTLGKSNNERLLNKLELLFIYQKIITNDWDFAESRLNSFKNKIRKNNIQLATDKMYFLGFLEDILLDKLNDQEFYTYKTPFSYAFKIIIDDYFSNLNKQNLNGAPTNLVGNDPDYKAPKDYLLTKIISNH